jgi:uncharacterized membrane protein
VDLVRIKQAEQLENTYFTVLEKLKEPHYARIIFGIPAILLLLFALSYYLKLGWEFPVALIGIYLILQGFGLMDALSESFRGLGFSVERLSFVFYVGSVLFFLISLIVAYGSYAGAAATTANGLVTGASFVEGFLTLFPVCLVLYLGGRIIDLRNKRMRYRAITQGAYIGYAIVAVALMSLASAWIVGQLYFWQFLLFGAIGLVIGYCVSAFSTFLRVRAIRRAKIKNKHVINEIGAYIGKITNVDPRHGLIFVKTEYGSVLRYDIDRITGVADRVTIR